MSAFGRKRPLKIDQIPSSERPLLGKADIQLKVSGRFNMDYSKLVSWSNYAERPDLHLFGLKLIVLHRIVGYFVPRRL